MENRYNIFKCEYGGDPVGMPGMTLRHMESVQSAESDTQAIRRWCVKRGTKERSTVTAKHGFTDKQVWYEAEPAELFEPED